MIGSRTLIRDDRNLDGLPRFERLLSELSARFISLRADEVDREIESALGRVGHFLGADLAVVWQWRVPDTTVAVPTHVYRAEGVPPLEEPLSQDQFPWTSAELLAGRAVVLPTMEALPPQGAVDRESARRYGIRSSICLPLAAGGAKVLGVLAFNALREERDWPEELVGRLRAIASVLANSLARGRFESSLRESEALLAAGAELAGIGFYAVEFGHGVVYVDARMRAICGLGEASIGLAPLQFWLEHLHPDDRDRVLAERERLHGGAAERLSIDYRYLHPSRGERWIRHVAGVLRRDPGGAVLATFGALRDATEEKQAEQALHELSRLLIHTQEQERAVLARELHDDITQRLAVLAIDIGRAEREAPDHPAAASLRSVRAGLARLSEDVHALASQLHPSVLRDLGLVEALRAECERRGRAGGPRLELDLRDLPSPIGSEAELCLFRVAQEALSNVARHAGANRVSLTLRPQDDGLVLVVRDDGAGFDAGQPRIRRSLGLASMRERVALAGGRLEVGSAPGRGTTIVAWLPVGGSSS